MKRVHWASVVVALVAALAGGCGDAAVDCMILSDAMARPGSWWATTTGEVLDARANFDDRGAARLTRIDGLADLVPGGEHPEAAGLGERRLLVFSDTYDAIKAADRAGRQELWVRVQPNSKDKFAHVFIAASVGADDRIEFLGACGDGFTRSLQGFAAEIGWRDSEAALLLELSMTDAWRERLESYIVD